MSIAIVTDSTAYLSKEFCQDNNITVLPLIINFNQTSYLESVDIGFESFYQKISEEKILPTSSQPSAGFILETFKTLIKEYDHILIISLSKEISGTYQTINMLASEFEDTQIDIYDSEISCQPQGFLVEAAVRLINDGMSVEAIINHLDYLKTTQDAYFVVDDLDHLSRGGRLSTPSAVVGSLLQVKPILTFRQGKITVSEKVRTLNKTISRLEVLLDQAVEASPYPLKVALETTPDVAAVRHLANHIHEKYPDMTLTIHEIGPVIGSHLGAGAFGIAWIADDEKS